LYISPRCGSLATRSSRIASTVAVSSGGSAEGLQFPPACALAVLWSARNDQIARACRPQSGCCAHRPVPSCQACRGSRVRRGEHRRPQHINVRAYKRRNFSRILGGQIGGARLKHNGPLWKVRGGRSPIAYTGPSVRFGVDCGPSIIVRKSAAVGGQRPFASTHRSGGVAPKNEPARAGGREHGSRSAHFWRGDVR
jgi:hypothetical protein